MKTLKRIRPALRYLFTGMNPHLAGVDGHIASINAEREAREAAEDKALVDSLIVDFTRGLVTDHMAARVAVEHYPLGQPRLTLVGGAS
jgi:hypothetical protein